MKKYLPIALLIMLAFFLFGSGCDVADACPMCRDANETDPNLPRAYMYSIIFMISMPALIFTGFGIVFYRLSRQEQQEQTDLQLPEQREAETSHTNNSQEDRSE